MTICRIPTICGIDNVIAVFLQIMQFVYNCEHPIHMTLCHINIEKPKHEKNIAKRHVRLRLPRIPIDYSPMCHIRKMCNNALSHRVYCETP